jgi:hypothetical protein
MAIRISRRQVLRGLLNGAAVSIALPRFDFMLNGNGTAYAQGAPLPTRFGVWAWANGVRLNKWVPTTTGANFELSDALTALAPLKEYVTVVSGMDLPIGGRVHAAGNTVFMTGLAMAGTTDNTYTAAKKSIDQEVADVIGKSTALRSIEIGVANAPSNEVGTAFKWWSHNGPDSPNIANYDTKAVFTRLFAGATPRPATPAPAGMGGSLPAVDLALLQRKSVLDVVKQDAADLNKVLGVRDRARLDQHLEGIRSIEARLTTTATTPVGAPANCSSPVAPAALVGAKVYDDTMIAVNKTMADLVAMAFACDLTRVLTFQLVHPGTEVNIKTVVNSAAVRTYDAHDLSHTPDGLAVDDPPLHMIVQHYMKELGVLLTALKSMPEGAGNVLDNTGIIAVNDVSDGPTHALTNFPILVLGKAGGKLKAGVHFKGTGNVFAVPLTVARAVGHTALASYGTGNNQVTMSLSGILT